MTKMQSGKIRIFFGRDMSPEEMIDAVIRTAREYGIPLKDDRKERGIPIVDSTKKDRINYQGKNGIAIVDDRQKKARGIKKRRK